VRLTAPLRLTDHVPGLRLPNLSRLSQPYETEPSGMPFWLEVSGICTVCKVTLESPPEPLNVTAVARTITCLLEPAGTQG
jgi:hypothetical protein